jgi:hypothetical protein
MSLPDRVTAFLRAPRVRRAGAVIALTLAGWLAGPLPRAAAQCVM